MSRQGRIIQGIQDLGELQGRKEMLSEQSERIQDIKRDIPSYIDKCEYIKNISQEKSERATKIKELVSKVKTYIESSRDLTGATKQNMLVYLQSIQDDAEFIIFPEEQYSKIEPGLQIMERFGGKRKSLGKNKKYTNNIMPRISRKSRRQRRKSMRGGYVWRTAKTKTRTGRTRSKNPTRTRKIKLF